MVTLVNIPHGSFLCLILNTPQPLLCLNRCRLFVEKKLLLPVDYYHWSRMLNQSTRRRRKRYFLETVRLKFPPSTARRIGCQSRHSIKDNNKRRYTYAKNAILVKIIERDEDVFPVSVIMMDLVQRRNVPTAALTLVLTTMLKSKRKIDNC